MTGIYDTTSLPRMPGTASTGVSQKERCTKTCGALSMMPRTVPRPETVFLTPSPSRMAHNFKLDKLKKYDGKENPENWITLYEIAVRSAAGDEHVMANYFPVVLDQAGHQWLLGLPEDSFDSWKELRQAFIDNFIATCEQPGNKYDLERIRDRKNELLRDYIRRFSDISQKFLTTRSYPPSSKGYASTKH